MTFTLINVHKSYISFVFNHKNNTKVYISIKEHGAKFFFTFIQIINHITARLHETYIENIITNVLKIFQLLIFH